MRHARGDHRGFTLVEMTISITIMAVIALALAGVFHSGVRALGAAKARAQGNEVATQGIEDLQRYGFNDLGLCGTHTPATPPAGLEDLAMLPNCPSPVPTFDCATAVGGAVPLAQYTCRRNNIDYTVRRYVAWVDPVHTTKRIAVYVDWTDLVGNHRVSQQSSLRSPDQGAIVGLAPPAFASPGPTATISPSPMIVLDANGTLPNGASISFNASTQNLRGPASTSVSAVPNPRTAGDRFNLTVGSASGFPGYNGYPIKIGGQRFTVYGGAGTTSWLVLVEETSSTPVSGPATFAGDTVYASFDTVNPTSGNLQTSSSLLAFNGTTWASTVTAADGFTFRPGKQYVTFGLNRLADGKANAAFSTTAIQFCPAADPTCLNLKDPVVDAPDLTGTLEPSGGLAAPITVTATTKYVNDQDSVLVSFATTAGPISVALVQDPANPCPAVGSVRTSYQCTWKATIRPQDGYRFSTGSMNFYFKASQLVPDSDPSTPDYLSTSAAVNTVTFS